jgi:hypothetical protein
MGEIYESVYLPLQEVFLKEIDKVDCKGIPYLCLPNYGNEYYDMEKRIVFLGMETYRKGNIIGDDLERYKAIAKDDQKKALYSWDEEFDTEFSTWAKRQNFITFIYKTLSEIYNIDDWKKLKNGVDKLSKGFAWANCNSIERYKVCAEKNHVSIDNYRKVKEASKIFDNIWNIVDSLKPDLIILLTWNGIPNNYFNGKRIKPMWINIEKHIRYTNLENTITKIIHVCHPRAMITEKGKGWCYYIKNIVEIMNEIMET